MLSPTQTIEYVSRSYRAHTIFNPQGSMSRQRTNPVVRIASFYRMDYLPMQIMPIYSGRLKHRYLHIYIYVHIYKVLTVNQRHMYICTSTHYVSQ